MKSDRELMADFRHGDRPAFHKLIRRHHVALLNFFHPPTGSQSAAEELTQKTFLRIFAELELQAESTLWGRTREDDAQPFTTFLTYLFRTGYICWLEQLRRDGLPRVLPQPITANTPEPPVLTGVTGIPPVLAETPSGIFALLALLPNELKPVVVLGEVCGLSYAEIAAVLNVPTRAVRTRMAEAFGVLRTASKHETVPAAQVVPPEKSV